MPVVVLSQLSRAPGSAAGQAAAALRPARVGRPRAGRRRRHPDLPRGHVRGDARRTRASPSSSSPSSATARPAPSARLHPGVHALREPRARTRIVIRPTVAHVDLGALAHNCRAIRRLHRPRAAPGRRGAVPASIARRQGERLRPRRRGGRARARARPAPRCSRAPTSRRPSRCGRPGVDAPDPRVRRAQPQRPGRRLRLRPDADDLDAGGGRARLQDAAARRGVAPALPPQDRHRHEPPRLPPRQPRRAPLPALLAAPEPRARGACTRTSPPPTTRATRCSPRSSAGFDAALGGRCRRSACRPCAAARRQQRGAAARPAHVVRPACGRACCSTASRRRPLDGRLAAQAGDDAAQPRRGGQGRARRRVRRLRRAVRREAADDRWRSCPPATPTASTRAWPGAAACSCAAGARRSSARSAWT